MDAEYLREAVGTALSQALTATLLANPYDPVEYLAQYLTKQIAIKQQSHHHKDELDRLVEEDAKYEIEQAALLQAHEQQIQSKASQLEKRQNQLSEYLHSVNNPAQIFDGFFNHLKPLIESNPVSFYSFVVEGSDAETQVMRFHTISQSATPVDNSDLINCKLSRADGKGLVFTLFDDSEENEESTDESNGESAAFVDRSLVVEARLPMIFLPNVRVGPKASQVHFFRSPRSGSFLAVRFRWQSVISEVSFDDALEKIHERDERKREEEEARIKAAEEAADEDQIVEAEDEGEEEEIDEDDEEAARARDEKRAEREAKRAELAKLKAETPEEKEARLAREAQLQREQEHRELLAVIVKQTVNQAVCADTMETGARLPDPAVEFIHDKLRALMESTLRIDRDRFKPELAAYQEFVQWQVAHTKKEDDEAQSNDDDAKEQRSKIKEDLHAAGQPSSAQDVELAYSSSHFAHLAAKEEGLSKIRACSFLRGGAIEVFQAALLLLGYDRKVVGDWEWRTEWAYIRDMMDQEFIDRVVSYRPRDHEDATKEKQAKKFIASIDVERITERNCITLALYTWVKAAIDVRRRVRLEHKKEKERLAAEEAARLAAEEEERQRKEAEEAAAEENEQEEEEPADE